MRKGLLQRAFCSIVSAVFCFAGTASAQFDMEDREEENPDTLEGVIDYVSATRPVFRFGERWYESVDFNTGLLLPEERVGRENGPSTMLERAAEAVVSLTCGDTGGSGVIIDKDGLILTNYHVAYPAKFDDVECIVSVTINLADELPSYLFNAVFVAGDRRRDLALLQISSASENHRNVPDSFPALPLGSSDALHLGDPVFLLGYAFSGWNSLTLEAGFVSGRRGDDHLKTTARMDTGDSGGAMIDSAGRLVGTPSFVTFGGYRNTTYFIGIDTAKEWMEKVLKQPQR